MWLNIGHNVQRVVIEVLNEQGKRFGRFKSVWTGNRPKPTAFWRSGPVQRQLVIEDHQNQTETNRTGPCATLVWRLVCFLLAGVDQSQALGDGGQTMRSGPYLWASLCLRPHRAGSLMLAVVYTKLFCVSFVFYCWADWCMRTLLTVYSFLKSISAPARRYQWPSM